LVELTKQRQKILALVDVQLNIQVLAVGAHGVLADDED
jgi:hypothetical protein